MAVLINKKVCDNARECSCILECPNKAFYYDEDKNGVAVHDLLCTKCRICMVACETGAVKVARNDEEYKKIKKEYDEDIRTVDELFVDRYGASPVEEKYLIEYKELDNYIKDANKIIVLELFNGDEAKCLVNSIPIKEIMKVFNKEVVYRKCEIINKKQTKKYNLSETPSLLIIENQEIIGKYDGFCSIDDKEQLLKYIRKLNI